jgi:hypothetical protein
VGHFHFDAGATGVEGVLEQYLDHAGGGLDDPAGPDLLPSWQGLAEPQ